MGTRILRVAAALSTLGLASCPGLMEPTSSFECSSNYDCALAKVCSKGICSTACRDKFAG